ncbi:MAG: hypothetical protein ACPHVM_09470, partial [Candidatus Puniceispirillaceae bacterium]
QQHPEHLACLVYPPFFQGFFGLSRPKIRPALVVCTLHASRQINDFCRQIFAFEAKIPASPRAMRVMCDKKMTAPLTG